MQNEYTVCINYIIQVNSSSCPGSLPNTVTLVLLDNQGNQLQSSSAIPWDNLTVIGHEEYQIEWSFDLQDNTQYQLIITTHNSIGQSTSDPFVISTLKYIHSER